MLVAWLYKRGFGTRTSRGGEGKVTFGQGLETKARVKSESLEAVVRQSSCIETSVPASSPFAQENAVTFVAVFWN